MRKDEATLPVDRDSHHRGSLFRIVMRRNVGMACTIRIAVVVFASILMTASRSISQTPGDLSQILIGRWEGEISNPTVPLRERRTLGSAGRALEIRSAQYQDGRWVVDAVYGVLPNGRLSSVVLGVEPTASGETVISFTTGANSTVRLTLSNDHRTLSGTFTLSRGHPHQMRLDKIK